MKRSMNRALGALALCLTVAALTAGLSAGTAGAAGDPTATAAMSDNPACAPLRAKLAAATTKKARHKLKRKLRVNGCAY
jgi:hypothetical protein